MSTDQYVFKPRPEVADWIDEHVDSWTTYCYDKIYMDQRKEYQNRFERIGFRILIILLGMILISFSVLSINIINYISLVTGGICTVVIGLTMLGLEVRNGRTV